MYNGFIAARTPSSDAINEELRKKNALNDRRHKNKTQKMANMSMMRREEWIMDATYNDEFSSKFFGGIIPLINSKHHNFRDVDMSSKGFSPFKSDIKDEKVLNL